MARACVSEENTLRGLVQAFDVGWPKSRRGNLSLAYLLERKIPQFFLGIVKMLLQRKVPGFCVDTFCPP